MRMPLDDLREPLLEQVVELQRQGRNVIVSGPNGTGRSHVLAVAGVRLKQHGITPVMLDGSSRSTPHRLLASDPGKVLLLDGLEHAGPPLLGSLATWLDEGGRCVCTMDSSNHESPFNRALNEFEGDSEHARMQLEAFHTLRLDPLPDPQVARFIHQSSSAQLDSATVRTIVALAEGRLRWALDLIELASAGYLTHFPRASISRIVPRGPQFPALHSVARALGKLSPEAAAAAWVLSKTEPIDLAGASDLVGAESVELLLRRGALMRHEIHDLHYVPPFVAAAVRDQASPAIIEQLQSTLLDRLLGKAALGLPLSESEAMYCTRRMRSVGARPGAASSVVPRETRQSIFHRVIGNLVDFGDDALARTLLLRIGSHDMPSDPLHRARILGALVGPGEGLLELDRVGAEDPPRRLAALHLRYLFRGEAPLAPDSPEHHDARRSGEAKRQTTAETVLDLWNAAGPITERLPELRRIARKEIDPGLGILAQSLADLDDAWRGRLHPESWLAAGDPLPWAGFHSSEALRHISGTVLLAQGLTILLAGEYAVRREELLEAIRKMPVREYHLRWARHLFAAATATACGELARAEVEWGHLVQHVRRFIPRRMHHYLDGVHRSLRAPVGTDSLDLSAENAVAAGVVRYLSGKHVSLAQQRLVDPRNPDALPVLRLGAMHISAVEKENPAELLRVADRLQSRELWAPAAFALTKAREIFLSRRTVRGVRLSSHRLERLEEHLLQRVSWYRPGGLPSSDYIRLTPRERLTASLAAEGLTNKEIAAHLHCSVRTVESHLAQARAKLGVATRKGLADLPALRVKNVRQMIDTRIADPSCTSH